VVLRIGKICLSARVKVRGEAIDPAGVGQHVNQSSAQECVARLLDQPQPMDGSDQWMMGRFVLNHAVYYRNHRRARVSEITIRGLAAGLLAVPK
jgi:hypothetical protein